MAGAKNRAFFLPSYCRSSQMARFSIADMMAGADTDGMSDDNLNWLSQWYLAQCNTDWEHSYGVKIDTLDNPGWSIKIDLINTDMHGRTFEPVKHGEPSDDLEEWRQTGSWCDARIEGDTFHVACGPLDLSASVAVFRRWVEASA